MRVFLVSDTHGQIGGALACLRRHHDIDRVIHLGDYTRDADALAARLGRVVLTVRGNNDWNATVPEELVLDLAGHRLYIAHGHRQHVQSGVQLLAETAREQACDIALYGHTHRATVERVAGVWTINPGSASLPRDGVAQCAILTLEEERAPEVEFLRV